VELLVVLVVIGVVTAVSGLGVMSLRVPPASVRQRWLESARIKAITSGKGVTWEDSGHVVRFLPDGRAIGPAVDPLTGEVFDATH
jgi:hypothetical protein